MDFLKLGKDRYSCRKFKDKDIEKEKLEKILEAGRIAPTAKNSQPQRIFIIKSEENMKKLKEICKYHFDAPVVLLITFDKEESGRNPYSEKYYGFEDCAIAITYMMLEATSLGLGTTYVGAFDKEEARNTFSISENLEPVALLPIGYPADDAKPSKLHDKNLELDKMFKYI